MIEATFNFHDRYGLNIRSTHSKVIDFYDAEYRDAKGPIAGSSKVVSLTWGKAHSEVGANNRYAFHAHKYLARWFYQVDLNPQEVEIQAVGNHLAIPMVHHMLVHPTLRYLCAMEDTVLLHASAVVRDGRSLILTGPGGTGKTTLSAIMLALGGRQWQIHADDYVFLKPGHRSFAYITRSHLYLGLFSWLPKLKKRLSFRERAHVEFFGRLRAMSREGIKWPLRISPQKLWPDHRIASQAEAGAVILIKRNAVAQPELHRRNDYGSVANELLTMNFREARRFLTLMSKVSPPSPDLDWEIAWRKAEGRLLSAWLAKTPVYQLDLPEARGTKESFSAKVVELLSPLLETQQRRKESE